MMWRMRWTLTLLLTSLFLAFEVVRPVRLLINAAIWYFVPLSLCDAVYRRTGRLLTMSRNPQKRVIDISWRTPVNYRTFGVKEQ